MNRKGSLTKIISRDNSIDLLRINSSKALRSANSSKGFLPNCSSETPGRLSDPRPRSKMLDLKINPRKPVNTNNNFYSKFTKILKSSETLIPSNKVLNEKVESIEKLPLTAEKAKIVFSSSLTPYEKLEIQSFKEIFYVGNGVKDSKANFDDNKRNLVLYQDDHLAYRYQIKKLLGIGSFSQVYEAYDWKKRTNVAVKIIRNKEKFKKQAAVEISFLKIVKEKASNLPFSQILASFEFRSHVCIVFKLLDKPIPSLVSDSERLLKICSDVLSCLQFLHLNKIIHCDLKPSNILYSENSTAHLIDLGTSTFASSQIYKYIQSRNYRAPEVIFRIKYSEKIDVWSLGCVLFEVAFGRILFEGETEDQVLKEIIKVVGKPPKKWLQYCEKITSNIKSEEKVSKIEEMVHGLHPALQEVITKCLKWSPSRRISANDALSIIKQYE